MQNFVPIGQRSRDTVTKQKITRNLGQSPTWVRMAP